MSMSFIEVEKNLKLLKLNGMLTSLEGRVLQVNQGGMNFVEGFSNLVQDELDFKNTRKFERNFNSSGLSEKVNLTDFDWSFNPKLPKKTCFELMTLNFIKHGDNAVIIGHPGTGKSHITKAIAYVAIQTGFKVVYKEAHKIFEELFEATQFGNRKKIVKQFSETELLIIDDLFLRKKLRIDATDDFQEIIMNRYSLRKSTLITSNRIIDDWGICLGDNAVASAIIDRLLHHCNLLKFEGKSYRLKESALRLAKENKKK